MEILMAINEMLDSLVLGVLRGLAIVITFGGLWSLIKWIWKKICQGYKFLFRRNH